MRRRDEIDSSRADSPLRVAEDAVVVDTTDMSIEEMLAKVEMLVKSNGA
jgi:cytidylate kinase